MELPPKPSSDRSGSEDWEPHHSAVGPLPASHDTLILVQCRRADYKNTHGVHTAAEARDRRRSEVGCRCVCSAALPALPLDRAGNGCMSEPGTPRPASGFRVLGSSTAATRRPLLLHCCRPAPHTIPTHRVPLVAHPCRRKPRALAAADGGHLGAAKGDHSALQAPEERPLSGQPAPQSSDEPGALACLPRCVPPGWCSSWPGWHCHPLA